MFVFLLLTLLVHVFKGNEKCEKVKCNLFLILCNLMNIHILLCGLLIILDFVFVSKESR